MEDVRIVFDTKLPGEEPTDVERSYYDDLLGALIDELWENECGMHRSMRTSVILHIGHEEIRAEINACCADQRKDLEAMTEYLPKPAFTATLD